MIHAKLSKTKKQLKRRQCNVHVRFPSAASDHNKFITKEMCQLHKETLYCAQVSWKKKEKKNNTVQCTEIVKNCRV